MSVDVLLAFSGDTNPADPVVDMARTLEPEALLRFLAERGIAVTLNDRGVALIDFPVDALSEDLFALLRSRGSDLVAALRREAVWQPLSSSEQAFYREYRLCPTDSTANVAFALRVRSAIDGERLRYAVAAIAERHPMLRARYRWTGPEPARTLGTGDLSILEEQVPRSASEADIEALLRERQLQPFNLTDGPVFRVHWLRRDPSDSYLLFVAHHAVLDGVSIAILVNDLRLSYDGSLKLPPTNPSGQYDAFVREQRTYLASSEAIRDLDYWKSMLEGAPLGLSLRTVAGATADRRTGHHARCEMPPGGANQVAEAARRWGSTSFVALLAAWAALVARTGGLEDVVLGTPIAGRFASRFRHTVGNFMNLVPIRVRVDSRTTFGYVMTAVQQQIDGAWQHGRLPYPDLAARLRAESASGFAELTPVTFTLQRAHGSLVGAVRRVGTGPVDIGPLAVEPIGLPNQESAVDLSLGLYSFGDRLSGFVNARTDRVSAETLAALAALYPEVVGALVAHPDESLADVIRVPVFLTTTVEAPSAGAETESVWTESERRVAALWREIGVNPRIPNQSFFEAGGHSLLATQLVSRLEREYRVPVSLRDIFDVPTVAGLAGLLRTRGQGQR